MDWNIILQVTLPIAALVAWGWSRLDKRFDNIDKRFDNISTELKDIGKDITDLKVQVGKLDTRVEERTLKVVHVQGNGTDGKNNGI